MLFSITKFVYCDESGQELTAFPCNPNGSDLNIAGICNQMEIFVL